MVNSGRISRGVMIGAAVFLLGVFLFLIVNGQSADCQSAIGQLGRAMSPEFSQKCDQANLMKTVGGLAAAGGLVTVIALSLQPRQTP